MKPYPLTTISPPLFYERHTTTKPRADWVHEGTSLQKTQKYPREPWATPASVFLKTVRNLVCHTLPHVFNTNYRPSSDPTNGGNNTDIIPTSNAKLRDPETCKDRVMVTISALVVRASIGAIGNGERAIGRALPKEGTKEDLCTPPFVPKPFIRGNQPICHMDLIQLRPNTSEAVRARRLSRPSTRRELKEPITVIH